MIRHKPAISRAFFALAFVLLPFFAKTLETAQDWQILWGTDVGLYSKDSSGTVDILWVGGKVQKIISRGSGWVLLTDQGVFVSEDLKIWEPRNRGLPLKVIKLYEEGEKSFITTVQQIKDLEIDPTNPEIMVCAFKDAIYLTRNGGRDWENLGIPNFRSNGVKAAAVTTLPGGGLTVFCTHSIYGVYYINPLTEGARWIEISAGLEKMETTDNADEVSDIAIVNDPANPRAAPVIYASQTFRRRLYRLDWERKTWNLIWADPSAFGAVDSLAPLGDSIVSVLDGQIIEIGPFSPVRTTGIDSPYRTRLDLEAKIRAIPGNHRPNCVMLKEPGRQEAEIVSLSELWLLDEGASTPAPGSRAGVADNKEGLYLPVNHAMDPGSLKPYLDIIEQRGLNMVVIDMKDDLGRLRFTPENSSLSDYGRVFWPVDIENFLKTMRDRGIYTVARIVVFKDPEAAAKGGGRYAVWDGPGNRPWQGYYDTRRRKDPDREESASVLTTQILPDRDPEFEILRTWYDEKWVDPYSEEIWDYNASVAQELARRGFDEIQFDYIRFPTDGVNLGDARYRWQDSGMDMDSAIVSFLRHVRSRVDVPISIDIYGANGWYRTGARTGQEVELFAPWVDVICPMYYPSHFEQDFLAQNPPELRPYRIYFQGTLRTRYIARGQVIVRPWAQAFYLNVSYDRRYYNNDYVRRQVEAVRDAGSGGFTYWNNSGRYDDIPEK